MSRTLIVPGLHGSGPEHWQSWFERELADTVRVEQENWAEPDLPRWAEAVGREIRRADGKVWIVAHSFGSLASALAVADYPDKVAGILFAAPADPEKFGVTALLPATRLGIPSVLVASRNDPWLSFEKAEKLAETWGARFIDHGEVGHLNVDAGFGPWPAGLAIFETLRKTSA